MFFIILVILIIGLYFILNKTKLIKYNKNNILFCILIFFIFTIIQGFRSYSIGSDTTKYIDIYNILKNSSFISIFNKTDVNVEIGFGLLLKILSLLGVSERGFLIVVSGIINAGLSVFIYKNSKNPLLSILIFMGAEFFTLSFTALRQMIALVIILNSYNFIKDNKYVQAFLMIILASAFHITSLVFLIVLILNKIKLNIKTLKILIILFLIIQIIAFPLLELIINNTQYKTYLDGGTLTNGIEQFIVIFIYTLIGVYFYIKNKDKYSKNKKSEYSLLIFIMIIAIFIQSFTWKISMIGRLMWYFYVFNMIYLPNIISELKEEKNKNIWNTIVGVLSVSQYVLFSMNMYNVNPYKFLD